MIGKCNTGGENVTPEVTTQTPIIQNITEALVGKAQGATASAETILKGYSAYVGQKLVEGTFEPVDVAALFGCTKYAIDKSTYASDMSTNSFGYSGNAILLNHSLGVKPRMAILTGKDVTEDKNTYLITSLTMHYGSNYDYCKGIIKKGTDSTNPAIKFGITAYNTEINSPQSTDTQVAICFPSGQVKLQGGKEYTLITMA